VLTTDTVAQAIERADPAKHNRGAGAAVTAIEMANVMKQLVKDSAGEERGAHASSRRRAAVRSSKKAGR
jgi:6,7-dimethyl-8-ribityllumazine synthase